MKSWMSTRRPACAPPPKIWICGIGINVAPVPPRISPERHAARRRGGVRRGHRDRERRVGAQAALRGVPSSAIRRASSAAWSSAAAPTQRAARSRSLTSATARCTSRPPKRAAAVAQVERLARAGRCARRERSRGPSRRRCSVTSASTVGRPRLSQTRRAWIERIVVGHRSSSSAPRGTHRPQAGHRMLQQRARDAPHLRRVAAASVTYSTGDLPSTRARNRPGSNAAARRSISSGGSQSTACR